LVEADVQRREFIGLIVGTAGWPALASAQRQPVPVIGVLCGTPFDQGELAAVRNGLAETGYVEGSNVLMEYRSAEGDYDRLPALAADLVNRRVALIVAIGGAVSAVTAKAATSTIPIVFANGGDPVRLGLVASMNRPGGNVTGISFFVVTLGAKRLALLRELVPAANTIGYLANPANASVEAETADVRQAAQSMRLQLDVRNARNGDELDVAFAGFAAQGIGGVVVGSDAYFLSRREQLAALVLKHALPAICDVREHARAGALISYGTDRADAYRQGGVYAGKVLKGEKPADLPAMQSTKFELVINTKTARALGLTVPPSLLITANEVVE
jgi:putative tryptophan/tyrosine transport system substrate-binding protein